MTRRKRQAYLCSLAAFLHDDASGVALVVVIVLFHPCHSNALLYTAGGQGFFIQAG